MPKLHLKSTPDEDIARRLRKKEKKEERRKRRNADANSSTSKRRRVETTEESSRKWASSDEDEPGPSSRKSHKHKSDYDTMQAEVEEREFRERMFDEMELDDRLDTLETRLNDYAHVPGRWRSGGSTKIGIYTFETPDIDTASRLDPRYMEDEEYTEWIRMGMHRYGVSGSMSV